MSPTRALLLVTILLLSGAVGWTAPVAGQEDLVTLTVSVQTPDGDPVRDARLTATWDGGSAPAATTRSNGQALIDVPAGADVSLRVSHADYVRNVPYTIADASQRGVTMTVYPKASARIAVEDADGPVADAEVSLRKGSFRVTQGTTGEDGTLDTGTVEQGVYTLTVSRAGYFQHQETVDVTGDTRVPVTLERGTVTLEVNVTDDHFEPPRAVGDATVDVDGSGSVTTQPTGIGRISVPVNAWAYLDVKKAGYEAARYSVYVGESDEQVDLTVERTPAVSLELLSRQVVIGERVSLSVTDEYGDPVAGATVRLDGEAVTETDDGGQAVVRIESTGNHTVVVEQGSLSAEGTVTGVETGGTTQPTTEEPAGTTTEDGQPGFGPVVALLAVLAVLGLGVRRARR